MLINKNFDPGPYRMLHMLVGSVLDYESIAYSSTAPAILKILDSIHNAKIRTVLQALPIILIKTMQLLSGEAPLTYYRASLTVKYCHKVSSIKDHKITIPYVTLNRTIFFQPICPKIEAICQHRNTYTHKANRSNVG